MSKTGGFSFSTSFTRLFSPCSAFHIHTPIPHWPMTFLSCYAWTLRLWAVAEVPCRISHCAFSTIEARYKAKSAACGHRHASGVAGEKRGRTSVTPLLTNPQIDCFRWSLTLAEKSEPTSVDWDLVVSTVWVCQHLQRKDHEKHWRVEFSCVLFAPCFMT